jgi:uncharacterized repeat protein (TIGR01451 family)
MVSATYRIILKLWFFVVVLFEISVQADAGNFTVDWNTLVYPAGVANPPAFVLTDQYGYQIDLVLQHTNANAFSSPLEDTTLLGGVNDIFLGSDAGANLGAAGESPATGVMRFYLPGTTTPVGVNGLSFLVTDIDPVDNNAANGAGNVDRCDLVTLTGNAGNPTLSYLNGAPTAGGTNTDFLIGPITGPGASGTAANYRTIFTATPPGGAVGAATTNLNIAANQAHCLFYFNTGFTSPSSNNDAVGSLRATYPNGTSAATVVYDEISENARNSNTGNAAARGIGLWGGAGFTTANSITLDKQTSTADFSAVGNVISYTYVVTNNGPLPLRPTQNIQIQDDKVGTLACPAIPAAGIAVGGTHTCSASYTVNAADVAAAAVTNIAIAGVGTGAQPFANRLQSNSDTVTVLRRPLLTLVKTVTNDNGGTATTSSVTLSATGPTTISGLSGATAVTNAAVNAGTYTLTETGLAGYSAGTWSCTSGTLTGSSLVLTVGQTSTCTINNNDIAPRLTLVKTVTDTSGGPSTVSSFTLTATGPVTISGVTGAAAVTNATVNAGTYALTETNLAGYTADSWSCTAGTLTGSSLVLALGQTSVCTINNVKLPTLTLRKISNGGTGAFGFSGTNGVATQTITTTIAAGTFTGSPGTLVAASTSTDITETMPTAVWQIQSTTCTGMGTGGTATLAGNTLTLNAAATAAGRNIVCTFTNQRLPTVSAQKITTGTAGGPFSFADTNLTGVLANITTVANNITSPPVPTSLIATTTGAAVTLTETSPAAWVSAGVTCSDTNNIVTGNVNPVAISATSAINIPAAAVRIGASINCVFTNAAAAPQLTIDKIANTASPANAGSVIGYTYRVTNTGNININNVTITDTHNGYGSDPVPGNEAMFNDVAPLGNSTDAGTNASWDVLAPGDIIEFTSTYAVVQADIDNLQ